jgi:hypothetical protein
MVPAKVKKYDDHSYSSSHNDMLLLFCVFNPLLLVDMERLHSYWCPSCYTMVPAKVKKYDDYTLGQT